MMKADNRTLSVVIRQIGTKCNVNQKPEDLEKVYLKDIDLNRANFSDPSCRKIHLWMLLYFKDYITLERDLQYFKKGGDLTVAGQKKLLWEGERRSFRYG
jgi:hypothetical protein